MTLSVDYDIIIIGAGHAGCEAAHAAARMSCTTLLITINLDTIAAMSCNPAIGGLAKGHLVREIDALGGIMAKAIDTTGIQYRIINTGKGPAVRALRAQADKHWYSRWMKSFLESVPNLDIRQGMADNIQRADSQNWTVKLRCGRQFTSRAVILTPGTFLNGLIHIGMNSFPSGRAGEFAADRLSDSLLDLGIELARLKTGTPARVHADTVDFSELQPQYGDEPPPPFSFTTDKIDRPQVPCYLTFTNSETHKIITDNLDKSPLYSGKITGIGPRYCPSLEDKVVKFPDRDRHQVFIEPEGLDTKEMYLNGISSSLPEDVQADFIHSIKGLERCKIMRPGYAIEYDFAPPTQLKPTLEVKMHPGLFFAGQINGTSGYEEAAGQGLIAAINAAQYLRDKEPLVLKRSEAYIGVMIDDLVTKGTNEPYRMFTSRAEYRLLLRQDNADLRLTDYGRRFGLIDDERYEAFQRYRASVEKEIGRLENTPVKTSELDEEYLDVQGIGRIGKSITLENLLARPEVTYQHLIDLGLDGNVSDLRVIEQVAIAIKYKGYIAKQQEAVERLKDLETKILPEDIDYQKVRGLRKESAEKLDLVRPRTLAQASRISGVNPADITVLLIYLKASGMK